MHFSRKAVVAFGSASFIALAACGGIATLKKDESKTVSPAPVASPVPGATVAPNANSVPNTNSVTQAAEQIDAKVGLYVRDQAEDMGTDYESRYLAVSHAGTGEVIALVQGKSETEPTALLINFFASSPSFTFNAGRLGSGAASSRFNARKLSAAEVAALPKIYGRVNELVTQVALLDLRLQKSGMRASLSSSGNNQQSRLADNDRIELVKAFNAEPATVAAFLKAQGMNAIVLPNAWGVEGNVFVREKANSPAASTLQILPAQHFGQIDPAKVLAAMRAGTLKVDAAN